MTELQHDFSETLKERMKKLFKKDRRRYWILLKKIGEIISSDEFAIERSRQDLQAVSGMAPQIIVSSG